ncbi:unnamed protein product [Parnassius mnemosyne]|uniref:Peptidase S1 domain-containing protein n=1 Tax=Parnassius mnemosyne TaxID=213953 RepID=A0AAV1LWM9_9NEOP
MNLSLHALLGFGSDVNALQWQCSGSIISERFILTAGHCTYTRELGPVTYALVDILSSTEHVDSSQRYKIVRIIGHPDYKPPKKYNDIALLQTEVEWVSENIRLIFVTAHQMSLVDIEVKF